MPAGYSEHYADTLKDRIGRIAAKAKDEAEKVRELVPDSSEVSEQVNTVLAELGKLELAAEEVIDRRTAA